MIAGRHRERMVSLRRWVSAFLFLSVFFLPLHIHVATAAPSHLSKECSCFHGNRTQLASGGNHTISVPQAPSSRLAVPTTSVRIVGDFGPQHVRAPPSFASL